MRWAGPTTSGPTHWPDAACAGFRQLAEGPLHAPGVCAAPQRSYSLKDSWWRCRVGRYSAFFAAICAAICAAVCAAKCAASNVAPAPSLLGPEGPEGAGCALAGGRRERFMRGLRGRAAVSGAHRLGVSRRIRATQGPFQPLAQVQQALAAMQNVASVAWLSCACRMHVTRKQRRNLTRSSPTANYRGVYSAILVQQGFTH